MKFKKTNLWILLTELFLIFISSCRGTLKLPMKVYQSIAFNTSTSHNILVSPSGLQAMLIITLMGTEGVTNHQIAKLLDIDTEDEAKKRLADYLDFKSDVLVRTKSLAGKDHKRWLSAIFHDKSMILTPELEENLKMFRLRKFEVEMEKKAAVDDVVKSWLSNDTHELQGDFTILPSTKVFMMNSINFVSRWKYKFDRKKTQLRDWKSGADNPIKIPMMETTNEFRLLKNSARCGCSVLEIPLEAANFSIFIFLPLPTSPNMTTMELNLSEDGLSDVIKEATETKPQNVHVVLPKLTLRLFGKLKEPLERLGLENLFYPDSPEMSGMIKSANASFGDIFQNLKFDMNDSIIPSSIKVEGNQTENGTAEDFIVDHPYMFALRDLKFNFTTFVGRVVNPDPKQISNRGGKKQFERKSLLSQVSFLNGSLSKLSLTNLTKPISLNLTSFHKGNLSEDYADKDGLFREADVVTANKTQAPKKLQNATSLQPTTLKPFNGTSFASNKTNSLTLKTAVEPWSKSFCIKMEETAYRIIKINQKCGKVDQKFIVETCVHYLKSCMDLKGTGLAQRTALLTAFNNSALNHLKNPDNSLTGKFWTDKATNILSDEKIRDKRQITKLQNCNEHERYCKARVNLMDKCDNAKILQENFVKNCGQLDLEKYEKKDNYQKKGFFGKLWDDVKTAFNKIG